jgi:hypothetical protein
MAGPRSRACRRARVAFHVTDTPTATATLAAAGASVIAGPVTTAWQSLNARLQGPAGLQLTLFSDLPAAPGNRQRTAGPADAATHTTPGSKPDERPSGHR